MDKYRVTYTIVGDIEAETVVDALTRFRELMGMPQDDLTNGLHVTDVTVKRLPLMVMRLPTPDRSEPQEPQPR